MMADVTQVERYLFVSGGILQLPVACSGDMTVFFTGFMGY